jgi:EcsC protein family
MSAEDESGKKGRWLSMPTREDLEQAFHSLIDWFSQPDAKVIDDYVAKLRAQNPGITDDELAWKIVHRKSLKSGLVGAVTGVGGLLTLPVTIPTDLIACWRIQIVMAVAIAHVYGHTASSTDLKTDIFLILAGDAAKETLKRFGIKAGKAVTKRLIQQVITRELMLTIWSVLGRQIITKAGAKSLFSFMKMVPLVGAPIGFAFDWPATYMVGKTAIKYYSGQS